MEDAPQTNPVKSAFLSIETVLQDQLNAADSLSKLLSEEAVAIRERNAEALTKIATEKLAALQHIDTLETQRRDWDSNRAAQDGLSTSEDNPLWSRVIESVAGCDRKNQLNGVMLRLRQESTRRALDLISGKDSATTTYTPNGFTTPVASLPQTNVSA